MLHHSIVSASEAKLGAFFNNGQTTIPLCTTLEELVHQQTPTPIETDKSTALGISKYIVKKINGCDILFVQGSNTPMTLLHLPGTRQNQKIGLFY